MAVTAEVVRIDGSLVGARQRLADALARRGETHARFVDLEAKANDLALADRALGSAEAALREFLFEQAVEGLPATAEAEKRATLGAAVKAARQRVTDAHGAADGLPEIRSALEAADAGVQAIVLEIVNEEGERLAADYRRHTEQGLRAQRAAQALADWAAGKGQAGAMAARLRQSLEFFPMATADDRQRYQRARDAHEASMSSFATDWRTLPDRLLSDPAATAPAPVEA